MPLKICKFCNREYEAMSHREKYCSPECKVAIITEQRKVWIKNNPEYMKNYMRERRKKESKKRLEKEKMFSEKIKKLEKESRIKEMEEIENSTGGKFHKLSSMDLSKKNTP